MIYIIIIPIYVITKISWEMFCLPVNTHLMNIVVWCINRYMPIVQNLCQSEFGGMFFFFFLLQSIIMNPHTLLCSFTLSKLPVLIDFHIFFGSYVQ